MTMRSITVGWLLGLGFAIAFGCSSQGTGGHDTGGGGAGGAASDAGFACGDASCSVGKDYCRELGYPGGASGTNDGGTSFSTEYSFACVPFADCAAHDCSCVPQNGGYFMCGTCNEQDGGGTLAFCGKI